MLLAAATPQAQKHLPFFSFPFEQHFKASARTPLILLLCSSDAHRRDSATWEREYSKDSTNAMYSELNAPSPDSGSDSQASNAERAWISVKPCLEHQENGERKS